MRTSGRHRAPWAVIGRKSAEVVRTSTGKGAVCDTAGSWETRARDRRGDALNCRRLLARHSDSGEGRHGVERVERRSRRRTSVVRDRNRHMSSS